MNCMQNDTSLLSRTISFLRFPMIFFILYLHVVLRGWIDGHMVPGSVFFGYESVRFFFVESVSRIFVPCFFFISGFLFFYYSDFSGRVYIEKMKRRFRSLLVPYLFWNFFVIALYFLGQSLISSMVSEETKLVADFAWKDWLMCFWNISDGAPINLPLWFLRDLIGLSILSPLIYWVVRHSRIFAVVFIGVLWFLWGTPTHYLVGLFFFTGGAWLGICKINPIERLLPYRRIFLLLYLCVMPVGVLMLLNDVSAGIYLQKIGILLGLCTVFSWSARWLQNRRFEMPVLEKSSFFVYAYHGLPLLFLSKLVAFYLHPDASWKLIALFLVLPVVVSVIGVIAYVLINRYFPRFSYWISGR